MIARYSKAFAALLGAATPAVVVLILGAVHVHVDPAVAAGISALLATVAAILAPANAPTPPATPSSG